MKKLIWTLSALALTGLCFTACGDDEEECEAGKVWDTATGTCVVANQQPTDCRQDGCSDSNKPYCVPVPNGNYVCSGTEDCETTNQIRDNDGYCVAPVKPNACETSATCEDGEACGADNTCVPKADAANVYRYVRIDDLSTPDRSKDPGADIDAVVIYNASNGKTGYAGRVADYKPNAEKFIEKIENNKNVAADPTKILKNPDAFTSYTNAGLGSDATCKYKDDGGEFTFVSLGGEGGYIIVEMTEPIVNGTKLDILEVGGCKLANTENDDGNLAFREKMQVFVSVTDDKAGSWKPGPLFERSGNKKDPNDQGLLSWEVSGL